MYDIPYVLVCCILAVAAGAQSYRAIVRFIDAKFWWLQEHLGLPWRQAPGHTGLRAILLGLDQKAVEQALRQHAAAVLANSAASSTIAIDGKTLRGSVDRFADVKALQWLSAFATEERLVIGQVQIVDGEKGGEIAAAQQLIEELGLQGKLFTLDALHCQKKTLQVAIDSGNDVLVQLKGNQPTLLNAMTALAQSTKAFETHHQDQLGQRNRIESRTTSVWPVAREDVPDEWVNIRCLVQVERSCEVFQTNSATWETRRETALYVCTRELSAQAAANAVRNHWSIENSLHHVRDVTLGEDASRIRRQPGVFAQLRTCALNLLRQAGHDNINAARQIVGWSTEYLLDLYRKSQR